MIKDKLTELYNALKEDKTLAGISHLNALKLYQMTRQVLSLNLLVRQCRQ